MQDDSQPDIGDAIQKLAIAVGALTIALIDKGILTIAEYNRAYAQATADVDQEAARQRDGSPKWES
jgi:hypothetical protein